MFGVIWGVVLFMLFCRTVLGVDQSVSAAAIEVPIPQKNCLERNRTVWYYVQGGTLAKELSARTRP